MWRTNEFDKNVLKPSQSTLITEGFTYHTWEINKFIDYLSQYKNTQPLQDVLDLLEAVKKFRSVTKLKEPFVSKRKNRTTEATKRILNEIAGAINHAQLKLRPLDKSKLESQLLNDALQYSLNSINERLYALAREQDNMYKIFLEDKKLDFLKKNMTKYPLSPFA